MMFQKIIFVCSGSSVDLGVYEKVLEFCLALRCWIGVMMNCSGV